MRKKPDFELDGFPAGSLIWVKCKDPKDIKEMSQTIIDLELDDFTFIVTSDMYALEKLDSKTLKEALRAVELMESMGTGNLTH